MKWHDNYIQNYEFLETQLCVYFFFWALQKEQHQLILTKQDEIENKSKLLEEQENKIKSIEIAHKKSVSCLKIIIIFFILSLMGVSYVEIFLTLEII